MHIRAVCDPRRVIDCQEQSQVLVLGPSTLRVKRGWAVEIDDHPHFGINEAKTLHMSTPEEAVNI